MRIGVPKEIREAEYRVGLAPKHVEALVKNGHIVSIEKEAGIGSGFSDDQYQEMGGRIVNSYAAYSDSDLVVKVKEPQERELDYLNPDSILFTFLHLAAHPELVKVLLEKNITGIDYATIKELGGAFPILAPMSKIAGELAVQEGAYYLKKTSGGKGILPRDANVLIFGGGNAGKSATKIALGMSANIILVEKDERKHELIETEMTADCGFLVYNGKFHLIGLDNEKIKKVIKNTDLLIGAVLVGGDKAPKVVTEEMVKMMEEGSVIVDISIDQGGCVGTSEPTSHKNPIFKKHGIIHYCIPNMPGVVPRTSTKALLEKTFPFVSALADCVHLAGIAKAIKIIPNLASGVNTYQGKITHEGLANALGRKHTPLKTVL